MSTTLPHPSDTQRVFESLLAVQRAWPVSVFRRAASIGAPDGTLGEPVAHMGAFPWTLREAFPPVADDKVEELARAFSLLCHTVLVCDDWMDASRRFDSRSDPIRVQVMMLSAYETFFTLFPAGSAFWTQFRSAMHEFVSACVEEQRAVAEGYPWPSVTRDSLASMVAGRNALARVAADGLAMLSGDEARSVSVSRSVDRFMYAFQMVDDAQDWREDLEKGAPSALLLRYARRYGADRDTTRMAARLYGEGFIQATLGDAVTAYREAAAALDDAACPTWRALIAAKQREAEHALSDVDEAIVRMRNSASARAATVVCSREAPAVSRAALEYLVRQWQTGYPEGQHLLIVTDEQSGVHRTLRADVSVRALAVEAYADAAASGIADCADIVRSDVAYLLSRCGSKGWKYFPELDDLPCDAETVGLVLAALHRADCAETLPDAALAALDRIAAHAADDGSIATWIVDAESTDPADVRQVRYADRYLSCDADPAVVATLLYGLHLHAPKRFGALIERGTAFVAARQHDGAWTSERYAGEWYPSFACARFLSAVGCDEAVSRYQHRLLLLQRHDGGWGAEGAGSDALATSIAALSLSLSSPFPAAPDAAARARAFLERSDPSSWGDLDFALPGTRCAPSPVPHAESFGTRTVTAGFVLRAMAVAANRTAVLEEAS